MWRSIAAKSQQLVRNLGATRNHDKVRVSLLPYTNCRFLAHSSVNIEEFPSVNDSSAVLKENSDTQFQSFASEGDIGGITEQFSQALGENGNCQIENFAPESADIGTLDQLSGGLVEEGEGGKEEGGAYKIDSEKLEDVLSLLQSSFDESLESNLDSLGLDLHEEFVVKVLETPLVLGDNLIRFFKWAIQEPDVNVTTHVIDVLVQAICSDLRKKDAYAMWDLVREVAEKRNVVLNLEILNRLIALFSKLGKGKAALEVFNKFGDFGCVPDSETYYYTIEALSRRSFFDWAWSVCEQMINAEALPDSEKVGKIIKWFCKGSRASDAHMVYMLAKEKNKYPPQSAVNFLISLLSQKDETVKLSLNMLDSFSGETRKYAIKPFSSVIRSLCRIKDFDGVKVLLTKMIDEGPPPGNAVFNSIINGYSKCGDMKEAIEMKNLMERRGLKPDLFTYTVIMSGYASSGQMEEACKILSEAKKKHSKLSPVTYHTLIRGYCKLEQFDKALELLAEMKDFGVQPNVDEYNKLIQSLCLKALDWETAEKLMEKMEDGRNLNGITRGLIRAVKELEGEGFEKEASVDA
ncbi:pentatricopeptide repeat-containing protein At3g02650, mitochondrial [Manihot esculenta]|uniref:Pentacotripeptide-repeat region of PRORP domain-containing protein n=1 Tax=Manihot esculenta TaxID=3983 RepID=A0A251JE59_MANES|nr:pentatricopeptide repeat-containing protein At3g02650, mitochondrial [Manihot esculenta]XP_021633071.1 pentatricopeptide repeat-containing protein At3g02650, mitochondrial [Manihot esculenta]OAY32211.1 hypothetical protein MANES_13G000200v8 [Manihot esculenta]